MKQPAVVIQNSPTFPEEQERKLAQTYLDSVNRNGHLLVDGDRLQIVSTDLKILHGFTGAAGQPAILSRALQRIKGFEARCLQITRSKFCYSTDYFFAVNSVQAPDMAKVFRSIAESFDIFHFHFRPFFFSATQSWFPIGYDIIALKAMGKRVCVHFRGSEVRLRSRFLELNQYAYDTATDKNTGSRFSEEAQIEYIRRMSALADRIFVVDPELQTYVPEAMIVERAIDVDEWSYVGVHDRERPVIVHAPSRRGTKGTNHIIAVLDELRAEGLEFDFQLVEGLTNQEARTAYERADIVIDQMRIGWYGVLSVEAMALGKAVICYIRADLMHHLGDEPPLAISNLDRLKDDLVHLITDKNHRIHLGLRARAYCERVHSAKVVAAKLAQIYTTIQSTPKVPSADAIMDIILDDLNRLLKNKPLKKQSRRHSARQPKSSKLMKDLLSFPRQWLRKLNAMLMFQERA